MSRAQRITQWCAAEPGPMQQLARRKLDPGSAEQRYALHRVRDTDVPYTDTA
ncbi:hypothetical protein TM239_37860 [Bradyrhizobium sp. TM239]|nr:hypothetical protein TM239_37860 [Bradyrhizobium sp. TM239]